MFFKKRWEMAFLCAAIVALLLCCHSENPQPATAPVEPTLYAVLFHEISPDNLDGPCASPDYFRDVLRMIQIGQRDTVTASDIVKFLRGTKLLEKSAVALTFDDGWGGNYTYAHPLLQEFGMKATSFVFTESPEVGQSRRCSWDNLREMQDSGVWEVQSHSHTHPNLCELDETNLTSDLKTSLERLRAYGFAQEGYIAYPFGYENERVEKVALSAGFAAGFATGPGGQIKKDTPLFKIPRTTVCQLFDQDKVCRKLGLETKEIRKELAIFDEDEGTFSGEWQEVKSKEPLGMYGDSCRLSQNENSSWSIPFSIQEDGFYQISLWSPSEKVFSTKQPVLFQIKIENRAGNHRINGTATHPTINSNGWTPIHQAPMKKDTYTLTVQSAAGSLFCLDAIKIEKNDPKSAGGGPGVDRVFRPRTESLISRFFRWVGGGK